MGKYKLRRQNVQQVQFVVGCRMRNVYVESMTFRDQTNFVACVLYLEPTQNFPDGLILTGGNDNTILVYKQHEPFATVTIKCHTNTGKLLTTFLSIYFNWPVIVCCLSKGTEPDTFLSGSWDATAKLWSMTGPSPQTALATFAGHAAAVWSVVQLSNGSIVTASADKTIRVHTADGQHLTTLQGHMDCVRSLANFPDHSFFLSASNDATIKAWSYDFQNIATYYGHSNYIYR